MERAQAEGRRPASRRTARLQAGGWFKPPHPGIGLPTLSEAVGLIQSAAVTLIERKAGDAATCVQFLRDGDLINRVVVQALTGITSGFHRLEPAQILGRPRPPSTRDAGKLTDAESPSVRPG